MVLVLVVAGLVGAVASSWTDLKKVQQTFFNWTFLADSFPTVLKGFWVNVKLFMVAEALVLVWAMVIALVRSIPGPSCGAGPMAGHRLRRPLPGPARPRDDLPDRVRPAPVRAAGREQDVAVPAGRGGPDPRLRRLRGRGLPGRHRERPLEPDGRGTVAGAHPPPDDAVRRRSPGRAPGHPAPAQRLHRPAEGHRPRLGHRPAGGVQPGPHLLGQQVQPVADGRPGAVLRHHHHPDGPPDRLPAQAGPAAAGVARCG